jgi:LL-diaminopimelate aminotransferase
MTGWRVGWVAGCADVIQGLARVKANIDSGIFQAIQLAAKAALESGDEVVRQNNAVYEERCRIFVEGLNAIGWKVAKPKATFYVWAKTPRKAKSSLELAKLLLERANIVATPGVGFGKHGEGYIRFTLTVEKDRLKEAVERMKVYLVDVM